MAFNISDYKTVHDIHWHHHCCERIIPIIYDEGLSLHDKLGQVICELNKLNENLTVLKEWLENELPDILKSMVESEVTKQIENVRQELIDMINKMLQQYENRVAKLESDVATNTSNIERMQADITAINITLATIQSSIANVTSDVNTLKNTVNNISIELTTVKNTLTSLQADVTALTNRVSVLENNQEVSGNIKCVTIPMLYFSVSNNSEITITNNISVTTALINQAIESAGGKDTIDTTFIPIRYPCFLSLSMPEGTTNVITVPAPFGNRSWGNVFFEMNRFNLERSVDNTCIVVQLYNNGASISTAAVFRTGGTIALTPSDVAIYSVPSLTDGNYTLSITFYCQ